MRKISLSALVFLALSCAVANAAPDKYVFDKDHTHVFFTVGHLGFSHMVGRVKAFDGWFTFDEKEPEKSAVDVTLKAASVDTDVPELNKTLMSEKFFNAAKYPEIHFRSTSISVFPPGKDNGRGSADLTGNLTLLDVTKPVTLHVFYNKSGVHPYTNNYISGFSADAEIKRSDFGMNAYLPGVGDKVDIHVEAEGIDPLKQPGGVRTPH